MRTGITSQLEKELATLGIVPNEIKRLNKTKHAHFSVLLSENTACTDINVYTDGSKMDGRVGYGFMVRQGEEEKANGKGHLPPNHSVPSQNSCHNSSRKKTN